MNEAWKLEPTGDKVIMVVVGTDFAIPVYVTPVVTVPGNNRKWIITQAMELMHAQHKVLWDILETIAGRVSRNRYVVVDDEEKLLMACRPVVGVTPQAHYRWKDQSPTLAEAIDIEDSEELNLETFDEKFLADVVARIRILTLPQAKVVWNAIIQSAMHWLLVKRRPLNLGFVTLFAAPYRANWKSILAKAYPKSYACFTKGEESVEPSMANMGLLDAFLAKELMDVDSNAHWVHWKLEMIPSKLWERAVKSSQRQMLKAGKDVYAKHIANSIRRSRKWIASAYRGFICRAVRPAARFSPLASPGTQVIIPETRYGGITPKALARSSGDICYTSAVDWKDPRLISLIEEEVDDLSKMPNLQCQSAKLRITGGYVVDPGDRGED